MVNPFLVLDLPSIYYRAFYALPESIKDSLGRPANAIKGSLSIISQIYSSQKASGVIAAIDIDWRPKWRVNLLPQYKTQRIISNDSEMPDSLSAQVPHLLAILRDLGIAIVGETDYEADDCIASLVSNKKNCLVVTGDKDLFQLINTKNNISVYLLSDKQEPIWDSVRFKKYFNFEPRHYLDYAVLRGDPSDGLPGVKKVGVKTAARLIQEYKDINQLIIGLKAKNQNSLSLAENNILQSIDYLVKAKLVSTAKADLKLSADLAVKNLTAIKEKASLFKIEKQINELLLLLNL